jgi:hypothetical protein
MLLERSNGGVGVAGEGSIQDSGKQAWRGKGKQGSVENKEEASKGAKQLACPIMESARRFYAWARKRSLLSVAP